MVDKGYGHTRILKVPSVTVTVYMWDQIDFSSTLSLPKDEFGFNSKTTKP